MADPVAIVSVVAGATVAITVPFISSRLERRRLLWQSQQAQLDELRGLLDSAVVHAHEAWGLLFDIEQEAQKEFPSTEWSPERLRNLEALFNAKHDQVFQDGVRIGLRLPESSIIERHNALSGLLTGYQANYRDYVQRLLNQERPPRPPTAEVAMAIAFFSEAVSGLLGVESPKPH